MMEVSPTLRRALRPVRSFVRRAGARRTGLGTLLDASGARAEDIRWLARVARRRGDGELMQAALLTLVRRRGANEHEEQQVRRLGAGRCVPATDRLRTPSDAAGTGVAGKWLLIGRDAGNGALLAALAGDARGGGGASTPVAWQQDQGHLPQAVAEQLAVCVLTRIAHVQGVVGVRSTDPSVDAIAGAVASASGTRRLPGGLA